MSTEQHPEPKPQIPSKLSNQGALRQFLQSLDLARTFRYGVCSDPRSPAPRYQDVRTRAGLPCSRIKLRPVDHRGRPSVQLELQCGPKAFHEQKDPAALGELLEDLIFIYRQVLLCTDTADYQLSWKSASNLSVRQSPPTRADAAPQGAHNRVKAYILEEGRPIPFLVSLGIMDSNGRVLPRRYDKFRQINKYLEFAADALAYLEVLREHPHQEQDPGRIDRPTNDTYLPVHIVDFGSGKAYLTFALYHFLQSRGYQGFNITGLDLKEDVVVFCNEQAKSLGFDRLSFQVGDIAQYTAQTRPAMVVSLHACDIATDAALVQAISWNTPVILAVPCCQHEFFPQIRSAAMDPILRHGISREKQASLVTDASRALMLEAFGYRVELVEFINLEHTPKNVLIRAYKKKSALQAGLQGCSPADLNSDPYLYSPAAPLSSSDPGYIRYRSFLDTWGIGPTYLELELRKRSLLNF
ncbi:MAG: SAM-dependent methyltransferase [Termitinemataceae bacterium]